MKDNRFDNKDGGDQNIAQGDRAVSKVTQTSIGSNNASTGTGDINITNKNYLPAEAVPSSILPSEDSIFLHREEELSWLDNHLHPDKVVAICAPGGMGKTALAARALGIRAEADLEQQVAAALGSKQALLVLDGAEEADDLDAVLRLRGTCGVLITTRKRTDCGPLRLDLPPLPEDQAEEVLQAYSQVTGEKEAIQGIEKILGGWPVALRIAGHYLHSTGEPAADYLRWLKKRPFRKLRTGGEHQKDNAALLLERSVEQVSADAVLVLRLAGVLAFAPISLMSVMFVLSTDGEDQEELELRSMEAVNELVNYGLLERRKEGLHIGHALIHEYAAGQLVLGKEELGRVAAFYIDWCKEQSAAGVPGYVRLDGERVHCLRLIGACLERELWREVKGLVGEMWEYLDRQGHWTEQLAAVEMRLTAARQAGDRQDEAICLNNLGYTCWRRGEQEQALRWYEQCLPIRRELGDRKNEGVTLNNIAVIYWQQGKYDECLEQCKQSLSIHREIGNRREEGVTLNNIGRAYKTQGYNEKALQYYEQCLPIAQEVGDKIGEGITLNNIAGIYTVRKATML
ncbi:MAG: tetratricopeptide repeat protein [Candidatus Electrothrix sp. YB6]